MDVRECVVAAVAEVCGIDAAAFADDATLDTIGIDSLDLLEIAAIVERQFDVEIDADDFEGVRTFGQAIGAFDRLLAASE